MPLKMNVGLSRKVGEANYSSRGASVHFEVELEPMLVREPTQLRDKIRYLFRLAREAIAEELHSQPKTTTSTGPTPRATKRTPAANQQSPRPQSPSPLANSRR